MKPMTAGLIVILLCSAALAQTAPPPNYPEPKAGDFTVPAYHFKTGEQMDVKLHYYTFGTPARDASGRVTNAVLILHGTGGSGRQFLRNTFAGVLFNPGQVLDVSKYYVVLADNVGHGNSSKPSDGLRMKFPNYDYDDMVDLQQKLLVQGLGVNHLRLVMGTSMGCMHSWVWAEMFPDFIDAAMPLACNPAELAGRNRSWRKMLMDGIKGDPAWNNGDYKEEPKQGLLLAQDLLTLVGMAPLNEQRLNPTRDAADRAVEQRVAAALRNLDANDLLYQVNASRNYNPEPKLETIKVPVMAVNSADDFINPPELGILERDIRRVRQGRAVVLPITDQTRGHGTHTIPAIWGGYLADLLKQSGGLAEGTAWTGATVAQAPAQPTVYPQAGAAGMTPPALIVPQQGTTSSGAYRVGGGVSAPRAIYQPDPEYSEQASKAGYQGTVVLWCVVGPDGAVHDVRVQRALGMGLDEKAIEAVKQWRFEPARKDGVPVAVQVNVEIAFHLASGSGAQATSVAGQPGVPSGVYRVGTPGVTPPRQISGQQPSYTEYARQQKIQGTVVVSAIINPDGTVRDVRVQRSLEPGLDQSAVETIRTWRFQPGTKDGQPVAVFVNIETNFRLY